jgi:hypothetical protein
MEIFSPGPVPYPGCYQCPRCNSREVYDSEKTIGVTAMTIDVRGPVDSTIVNVDKVHAKRCRYCNSVAPYIAHPKAVEEAKARKVKKIKKMLKISSIVLGILFAIILVINISTTISQKIETNNFNQSRAESNQKLEGVRSEWQAASDSCQLGYTISIEKVNPDPDYDYGLGPRVDAYIRIKAEEFGSFWQTQRGQALDCFSEKIYGVKLSEKLILTEDQFKNRKESWDIGDFRFYDGVEDDGTIWAQGVIGDKDDHLDGYLTYSDDYDEFHISMAWELDKDWFERAQGF